ncbi:hypothetical protein SNE40_020388 [Patella caerulea]|uniref:EF-hand domain-containing protein n=1 Tax=Patella caerulea TaxID=87958 RepID=A0AAN8J0A1_PATCE
MKCLLLLAVAVVFLAQNAQASIEDGEWTRDDVRNELGIDGEDLDDFFELFDTNGDDVIDEVESESVAELVALLEQNASE